MTTILERIIGVCLHGRMTFPRTPASGKVEAAQLTGAYVTCLACGKELPYDLERMKVVSERMAKRWTEARKAEFQ